MHSDDREQFMALRRQKSAALGQDEAILHAGVSLYRALDKYDYTYLWTFLGVPIIQMPADVLALQEVIWATRPDVIIETGVARGGSLIFFSAVLRLIGKGKVIGIDVDIRRHNRETIETHPMSDRITLVEGNSVGAATISRVRQEIPEGASVMVVLDSDHGKAHVLDEMSLYGEFVTPGQYLVVSNTILGLTSAAQTPRNRAKVWLQGNEPLAAIQDFLPGHPEFEVDGAVNGKLVFASSPGGYLRRLGSADSASSTS
jgi:cephalosporin hydroxylase